MNILHVLSQFEVTGAEVYAVTLAHAQQQRGHSVHIVSDTLHTAFQGNFLQQPIGIRSYAQRLRNISFLIRFIREKNIHVVHAHSRAASWVCRFAAGRTHTPFVSTVHGRQHLHASSTTWSVYGNHIIAVSESLKNHLIEELGLKHVHITCIPNGLETERWLQTPALQSAAEVFGVPASVPVLLFVGRLSGPKGDVVRVLLSHVFPELIQRTPCSFQIIGGLHVPDDIPRRVRDMQHQFGPTSVVLREFQSDLAPFLYAADVVIGSGRVVMESLLAGRPTLAFGETAYEGIVTTANFDSVSQTNFGDTGVRRTTDSRLVTDDLLTILQKTSTSGPSHDELLVTREQSFLQKRTAEKYDIHRVERRIEEVYQEALSASRAFPSIPILMYHRIVSQPVRGSRHGIWITTGKFEQQLRSLQRRGITPITFVQVYKFLRGESTLPPKPIILTFDDGYEDNYTHAFPLLQKFRFPAVIFLVTNRNRRNNYWDSNEPQELLLTDAQIREMAEAGIEFGSHTVTHPNLSHCTDEQAASELYESKKFIEQLLKYNIISVAYPYGALNERVKEIAVKSGYTFGIATGSGPLALHHDYFEIRRTQIFPWTSRFGFWKKTQNWYVRYKYKKTQSHKF